MNRKVGQNTILALGALEIKIIALPLKLVS